ncbi:exopolyphosphatase [Desulfococcaceae bacterium HSG7]|nr:exopolyphosphatase [Desulfococcaceae bacterium HSG7]
MRIVTRPDFDGVICAVLLYETESITHPVKWVEPADIQKKQTMIKKGDILANLPFDNCCSLWFDHHYTNQTDQPYKGALKIAPSAAGVVFEYYQNKFKHDYGELVHAADKIDSADFSQDEVRHPEKYPYILLSMTITGRENDASYWDSLVTMLRKLPIEAIMDKPEIKKRCASVIERNEKYKIYLKKYTKVIGQVAVSDFRSFEKAPHGNRFLVYSLFPETVVSMRIFYIDESQEQVVVSVGHSIFNRNCNVNVGKMLSAFEGGGHRAAAACSFHVSKAEQYIPKIIDILVENKQN